MSERLVMSMFDDTSKSITSMKFFPKIGLLNCDGREHLQLLTETLFMGQYMGGMGDSNSELWANYNVFDYQLPSQEELSHMQAIIIPGSIESANNDNISWVPLLLKFIQNVHENHPDVKILGICFGSQIVARALGGELDKCPNTGFSNGNLFIGKEVIKLNE